MNDPNKIIKLDEAVINRIAAGEVIQRPANALKELIENSLDAKSTNIQITVKNGGLKLLQIQDNGTGIRKEDLEIVCHRFTTSKLKEFEDLHKISTYGFRGEALASISHIAHLTITSKTKNDICAYQANYVDGLLKGPLKPIAGNQGTIINVEDLFYNMHVRRAALRSVSEEYQKIADVVSKYAVHNASVGFSLKKAGENIDIRTPSNSNQTDNVRIIYGSTIARELLEFEVENTKLKFKASGLFTNANFHTKKMLFLLFINHRLVDCSNLKKLVDQVYATYLPKNTHPFVYLSLEIDPINIDVNVHPTKHEVHFLNEDEIIEAIITALEAKLLGCNNSRAFYTQAKLPGVVMETHETLKEKTKSGEKTINPKDLVRTDPAVQKLDKFLFQSTNNKVDDVKNAKIDCSITEEDFNNHHEKFVKKSEEFENLISEKNNMVKKEVNDNKKPSTSTFGEASRKEISLSVGQKDQTQPSEITRINKTLLSKISRVETKLTSILELRKEIEENCHRQLRETFAQHVFVGSINPQQALIQYSTKLYLCNTTKILSDLFYQSVLYNFQNFAYISFVNAFPLYDLILLALDLPETGWTPEDGDKTELATRAVEILVEKAEMLNEYFSIEIDDQAHIKSLPILLENYVPDLTGLPLYLLRLATEVDWEQEKNCFQTFAVETGKFYAQISEELQNAEGKDWKWITEHILYPAVKEFFIPSKKFTENAAILEIANLPNLYKVFERC